jgi:uncharacterized protein (DUF362 family)
MASEWSRRVFLRRSAQTGLAVGLAAAASGCDPLATGPIAEADSGDSGSLDTGPKGETALVGIASGATTDAAVREAVRIAGGLSFIEAGQTVVLKPNCVSANLPPYTTEPAVIAAVIGLCYERGAGLVRVVERSFCPRDTRDALEQTGILAAAEDAGAEVVALSDDDKDWALVTPKGLTWWTAGFRVPRAAVEADHVIGIPVLKTHNLANYTLSIKNFVGYLFCEDRVALHFDGDFHQRVAELVMGLRPAFHVLDATQALLSGGPLKAEGDLLAAPGLVLASADPVALDATGIALLRVLGSVEPDLTRMGVWEQPVQAHAVSLGLGISGPDDYSVAATGFADLAAVLALVRG